VAISVMASCSLSTSNRKVDAERGGAITPCAANQAPQASTNVSERRRNRWAVKAMPRLETKSSSMAGS
jgi:hypothetical protein